MDGRRGFIRKGLASLGGLIGVGAVGPPRPQAQQESEVSQPTQNGYVGLLDRNLMPPRTVAGYERQPILWLDGEPLPVTFGPAIGEEWKVHCWAIYKDEQSANPIAVFFFPGYPRHRWEPYQRISPGDIAVLEVSIDLPCG